MAPGVWVKGNGGRGAGERAGNHSSLPSLDPPAEPAFHLTAGTFAAGPISTHPCCPSALVAQNLPVRPVFASPALSSLGLSAPPLHPDAQLAATSRKCSLTPCLDLVLGCVSPVATQLGPAEKRRPTPH